MYIADSDMQKWMFPLNRPRTCRPMASTDLGPTAGAYATRITVARLRNISRNRAATSSPSPPYVSACPARSGPETSKNAASFNRT